jgi:hypothetical protein
VLFSGRVAGLGSATMTPLAVAGIGATELVILLVMLLILAAAAGAVVWLVLVLVRRG